MRDNQQPSRSARKLIIYSITNLLNGKQYVGRTMGGLGRRKAEHMHRLNLGERDHKLYQAMRKHGVKNFRFDILCHVLKPEYLESLERYFVEQLNTFHDGYNMTCGGEVVSDETRSKLSKALKGREVPWIWKAIATRRANGTLGSGKGNCLGATHWRATEYLVRLPSGEQRRIKGLRQFCRDNGLDHSQMLATMSARKGQTHHKGYVLLERFND